MYVYTLHRTNIQKQLCSQFGVKHSLLVAVYVKWFVGELYLQNSLLGELTEEVQNNFARIEQQGVSFFNYTKFQVSESYASFSPGAYQKPTCCWTPQLCCPMETAVLCSISTGILYQRQLRSSCYTVFPNLSSLLSVFLLNLDHLFCFHCEGPFSSSHEAEAGSEGRFKKKKGIQDFPINTHCATCGSMEQKALCVWWLGVRRFLTWLNEEGKDDEKDVLGLF